MGATLHVHQFAHLNTPRLTDPPDVVAAQVDQHNMLRTLFFISLKLLLQPNVFFRGFAPGTGAGKGSGGDRTIFHTHQNLRGSPDNEELASKVKVKHIRGGVYRAQRPVDIEWSRLGRLREPL